MNWEVIQQIAKDNATEVPVILVTIDEYYIIFNLFFDKTINSAFWGNIEIKIYDRRERLVAAKAEEMTVCYNCGVKKIKFARRQFPPGYYKAALYLLPDHEDGKFIKLSPSLAEKRQVEFMIH